MLFDANRFHILVAVGWQASIFVAVQILFPIFSNYLPEWQCDDGPPSRDCAVLLTCQGNVTFLESPFQSAAMEYQWICDSSALYRSFQSQMQFFGMLFATLTVGPCSDLVGRKSVAVGLLSMGFAALITSGFVPSWQVFIATRFITGFVAGGVLIAVNILVMELLLPTQRMAVRAVANWGTARLCLTLICWYTGSWRSASLVSGCVALPAVLIVLFVYPESPTWLHVKGCDEKLKEAETLIATIAGHKYRAFPTKSVVKPKSFLELVRSASLLRRLAVFWCMWFVASFCVYSTDLNSNTISGDFFLNQICFCAVLICSKIILVTIDTNLPNFSRRKLHQWSQFMVCCAYTSLSIMSFNQYKEVGVLIANIVGTVFIEYTWDACYLCVVESMETSCRASATGSCSLVSRVGAIAAPMLGHMSTVWPPAIYVTVAILGFLNLIISFMFLVSQVTTFPPETIQKDSKDVNLDEVRISETSVEP